jgi:hypothetical protein
MILALEKVTDFDLKSMLQFYSEFHFGVYFRDQKIGGGIFRLPRMFGKRKTPLSKK